MHHPAPIADTVAAFAGLWGLFAIASFFMFVFFLPLMAFVVTLNIRGIRKELRTIAEQLELPSRRL